MTREESLEITSMILSHWPGGKEWGKDEIDAYARAIQHLQVEIAMSTVLTAVKEVRYRPSVAELLEFYRREQRRLRPAVEKVEAQGEAIPFWVRRWICARLLFDRWGKERDDRRFPEQGDFGDLTVEMMPEGAWEKEAASLPEEEFSKAFNKAFRP